MAGSRTQRNGDRRLAVHQELSSGLAELVPDISRADAWILYLAGAPQSQVDLADPTYLEFEYIRRIAHLLDIAAPAGEPLRVLHLGGGALTLPRYVAATRPGSSQLVAESDPALVDLVRTHLPLGRLRQRIRIRVGDAREILESVRPASFHVVISDVFAGARTPRHLTTAECAAAAARQGPGGHDPFGLPGLLHDRRAGGAEPPPVRQPGAGRPRRPAARSRAGPPGRG